MTETLAQITLWVVGFFIGVALTVKFIFSIASGHSDDNDDNSEGCLGNFIVISALLLAMFFFYLFIISIA